MFVLCSISPTPHQPSWWFVGYHNKISNNSPTKELHTLTDGLVIFGMAATPSSSCERTQTRNLLGVKGSQKTTYDWIPIIYAPPTNERNWLRHRGGCERTCIRNYSRNTPGTLPGHSRDTSGTLPGVASAQTKNSMCVETWKCCLVNSSCFVGDIQQFTNMFGVCMLIYTTSQIMLVIFWISHTNHK